MRQVLCRIAIVIATTVTALALPATDEADAAAGSDRLTAGQTLTAGQSLQGDAGSELVMQYDGNLVLHGLSGAVEWVSRTGGNPGARLVLQAGDGNLVIYSSTNRALWNNGARGTSARLVLQSDGNLVESSGTSRALWDTRHDARGSTALPPTTLYGGDRLTGGWQLRSGPARLTMQYDGNLVLAMPYGPAWTARTGGHPGAYLVMQGDGNAVVYSAGRSLWNSRTGGNPGARLVMQDDGNLVIYSATNRALWNSDADQAGKVRYDLQPGF